MRLVVSVFMLSMCVLPVKTAEAQRECGNGPCGYFGLSPSSVGLSPPSNYAPAQRAVRGLKCEPWRSPETCPFKRTITRKR
jgi:hypothetical protein